MNSTLESQYSISSKNDLYLSTPKKLLIDGEWQDSVSGGTFEVRNPATEEVIARVTDGQAADIDLAVKAARRAFESGPWARMTPSDRSKIIWKIADLLEENADQFAELEALDNGKPITVAKAADVALAVDLFRYMAGWATKINGDSISISVPYMPGEQFHTYTKKEPVGVVGQIIPWNFPLLMAAWKLGPALATGCTIVLKPAEETPLSAIRLGELMMEAGLPKGVVNIVTGFGETAGAPLAAHPDVDKIAFTGSTDIGRLIVKAAGETNLKKVTLELGGKSPNIILDDADLDLAIPGAASAIFFNHGQCCCAGSRLMVQESIFDKVVEGVAEFAQNIKVGNGLDAATQMGPLVSTDQFNRVSGFLDSGKQQGARAVTGGNRFGDTGYFVEPTVFVDTRSDMRIVQEEIFGPVVCAMPFKGIEDVAAAANGTDFGLAAGIWTRDVSKAHSVANVIRAGNVWINCYNIFDAALPFGGYKQSGWGREMGKEAIDLYTETKAVTIRL
ncbi:aldehyde dehydrogenase family protein [Pelagicoccus albus]|uniref:Aldehyde dehydrogenase family protein n=1 Tax=Pelagicoccus albus TaxID=415222 RepID=A0A7X1B6R3_9BACT|nr:aldehyde dehydrogenase family protein [Pelagicoccus albus]MBC2606713.1 aldehyde dehydrogenase family protein [Pelagicoccus albus]